jgi:diguanylate cyclase (GGDEF)-like protein
MALDHPLVLCVDDDPIVRGNLSLQLGEAGYPTLQARNIQEAMDLISIHCPRIVVSGWVSPEADGMELCRLLRARDDLPFIYVIMLTAPFDKACLVEAYAAGVDDFLNKPIEAGELEARLHAARRVLELEERLRQRMDTAQRLSERLTIVNARLKELASTDELTGLYNRRQAVRRLNELWKQAGRYGNTLSVAIADVDRFKPINDQFGHAVGDAVLRQVAKALGHAVRDCDIVCRIGGDEFLMLMPNTTAAQAELVAQRARQAVRDTATDPIGINVSIGVAERAADMNDPQELLQAADRQLYAAKAKLTPAARPSNVTPAANASLDPPEHVDEDATRFARPVLRN